MKLTFAAIVVADVLDRLPDDALIVDLGLGCDLSGDHDHPRLGHSLACNLQTHINVEEEIFGMQLQNIAPCSQGPV